jgi:hypothetical protein
MRYIHSLRIGITAITAMIGLWIAWAQCPGGVPCPLGCYAAVPTGFNGQCGSIGQFPNQFCCITVYLQVNSRRNPDCTGDVCGSALIPIRSFDGAGVCNSNAIGTLQCGVWSYHPGSNQICAYGGCIEYTLIPMCPSPPRPRPRIDLVTNVKRGDLCL